MYSTSVHVHVHCLDVHCTLYMYMYIYTYMYMYVDHACQLIVGVQKSSLWQRAISGSGSCGQYYTWQQSLANKLQLYKIQCIHV